MSQNDDLISRQAAIDAVRELYIQSPKINNDIVYDTAIDQAHDALVNLPSAQPEPAIPLQWIEAQIEWLKSLNNAYATSRVEHISAMVNIWKDKKYG